jgi:hypothetical protein
MAMWAMIVAGVMGMSIWFPVQLIAAFWYGPRAITQVCAQVIGVGLMTHMMVGAMLGLILAGGFQLFPIRPGWWRVLVGVGFGMVVWLVSQYLVLPAVDPLMALHMTAWTFAVGHMIFGIIAALFLLTQPIRPVTRR